MTIEREVYTLSEFADAFRISLSSVKDLIASGELVKVYLTPQRPVITKAEAKRFLESRPSERPQ